MVKSAVPLQFYPNMLEQYALQLHALGEKSEIESLPASFEAPSRFSIVNDDGGEG